MAAIVVRKELRELIPPLDSGEYAGLEASLIAEGCRDPLVVWIDGDDQVVIDGHNRYDLCLKHNIKFKTVVRKFDSITQAKLWMIENQMGRRNLADIDRISLARAKEALIKPKAEAAKKEGNARGGKGKSSANLRSTSKLKSTVEAAKSAGVGERTYDAGKAILDAAERGEISQQEIEAIRRKEKSIHRVAKDLKDKRQKTQRQANRIEAAAKAEPQFFDNVHIGDFRDHFDKIADGSLSLVFTDPPYDRKAAELYGALGEFASAKLADGGSLLCYVGHIQLIEALTALSSHLRYWWPVCCLHSGKNALMREYGIRVGWKPMVWFVKGSREDKSNIVRDVISGGEEKSHHDWQQAQAEAAYWIAELCPSDGIVCDPFLGGGTTAAAAIALKRRWVGFEKDHDQAIIAMSRVKGGAA